MRRYLLLMTLLLAWAILAPAVVQAQSHPWEQPLTDISTSVVGPVALAGFLIALGIMCLSWMFGWTAIGAAVGIVIFGAILGNSETIASWLGLG